MSIYRDYDGAEHFEAPSSDNVPDLWQEAPKGHFGRNVLITALSACALSSGLAVIANDLGLTKALDKIGQHSTPHMPPHEHDK